MTAMVATKMPTTVAKMSADTASESRVDRDSHFNGLYETKQNLRIEGIAEGEIRCDGTLTVAEGARVKAKVMANTVTIAGELEGEVVCQGVFQIMPSGKVAATVSARRLSVQEGGFYDGEFHMITEAVPPASPSKHRAASPAVKDHDEQPAETEDTIGSDEWWAKMTGNGPSEKDSNSESEPA